MKIKLIASVFLVLLLLGCKEDDEINPEILTQKQWLNVIEYSNAGQTYEIVNSIDFAPDGKVYSEAFLRNEKTKDIIGFHEYFIGNYQISDNLIKVSVDELYTVKDGEDRYKQKNELSIVDGVQFTREYQLRKKNSELHTIMPPLASSLGIIYKRVD